MGLVRTYSPAYQRAFVDALAEMRAEGAPWTPRSAHPIFWLDGDLSTLVGSSPVTSAGDAAGSAQVLSSGSNKPNRSATLLNGHHGFDLAANSQLYTTSGGVTGAAPFTQYAVGRLTAVGASVYGNLAILGNPIPNTSGASCIVGGTYNGAWWEGGYNGFARPVGGTADTADHVFMTGNDGTNTYLFVDGTYYERYPLALSLTAGFGIANWFTGSLSTTGRLYSAVWRAGFDAATLRTKHLQYLAKRYGLTLPDVVICVGDSLTFGSGASNTTTKSYPGQLPAQLGSWAPLVTKHGFPGINTAGILSGIQADSTPFEPGGGVNRFAILEAGTNDAFQFIDGAPGIANLKAYLESLGLTVIAQTVCQWVTGHPSTWDSRSVASANTSNAWIAANFPPERIVDVANDSRFALTSGGTAYDGTYRIAVGLANEGHFTDAGYLVVAQLVAAKLLALKQ